MRRGPITLAGAVAHRVDFLARADAAWASAPDWVRALAAACQQDSQAAVAKRVGYSAATISQVLSNSYAGDLGRVEEMVRGALMSLAVDCPVLGEIGRDRCLSEQDEPFRATSAYRAQLFHACRNGCPHARTRGGAS